MMWKCQSVINERSSTDRQLRFDFLPSPAATQFVAISDLTFIYWNVFWWWIHLQFFLQQRSRTHFGSLLSMVWMAVWNWDGGGGGRRGAPERCDDAKKGNNEIIGDTFSLFVFIGNTIIRTRPQVDDVDDDGASRLNPRSHSQSRQSQHLHNILSIIDFSLYDFAPSFHRSSAVLVCSPSKALKCVFGRSWFESLYPVLLHKKRTMADITTVSLWVSLKLSHEFTFN